MHHFTHNGHTLTWKEYSDGDEVFLFIHGWSVGKLSWEPVIGPYTTLGRCVAIDLPGHHPATVPDNYTRLSQDELFELETRAIEHICQGKPVTLIGHSAGGLTALGVAARLGTQVRRIVLINSVVWGGEFRGLVGMTQWLMSNNMYGAVEGLWNMTLADTPTMMTALSFFVHRQPSFWTDSQAWDVCRDAAVWYRQHKLSHLTIFLDLLEQCDARPLIPHISVPVLVIVGEQDPVVPAHQSYWLAERLPTAQLRVFEETGHIPQLEAPMAFRKVMLDWLKG